jgi:hypothetical protein
MPQLVQEFRKVHKDPQGRRRNLSTSYCLIPIRPEVTWEALCMSYKMAATSVPKSFRRNYLVAHLYENTNNGII